MRASDLLHVLFLCQQPPTGVLCWQCGVRLRHCMTACQQNPWWKARHPLIAKKEVEEAIHPLAILMQLPHAQKLQ
ncbi:uncharacterized [Tachysurus ichikawai]